MKNLLSILFIFLFLQARSQTVLNLDSWTDSVTLNGWENTNFVRADTVSYKGNKLYSGPNQYFAWLRSHDVKQGSLVKRIAVNFNPQQIIIVAASRSNVGNKFRVLMRAIDGDDTIGTIKFTSLNAGADPDFDPVNKSIIWQQYVITLDSEDYYLGHTADSLIFSISSLTYSGSMNDTTDLWVDQVIFLDHHTAISKLPQVTGLTVYPNPASDMATLKFNSLTVSSADLTVYDINGRALLSKTDLSLQKGSNSLEISTAALLPGLYFCEIRTASQTVHVKVQVLH